ncbi:uncharacterized protein M421DRAFT_89011 [Didymella exigua CBS 183.55]|uniref:Uncharacterized protein n=1 Tax=Didymella exigua CBS 183.55 TaxID=1150837 RepID=A0A6A5S2A2_9PLEO|nr:uncharacterized protein M421DRAFT_89011 [Didymella exigua CBS 183.55]KAF1932636.1 hypothetical protein M421DRAFT_89011 [Didymella exigua CBS 183.55]
MFGEIALAVLTKVNYQTAVYSFCGSFISISDATTSVTVTQTSFTPITTTVAWCPIRNSCCDLQTGNRSFQIRTKIPLATSTATLTATVTQASPTITAFSIVTETTTTQATTTITITLPGTLDASCNSTVYGAFRSCSNSVGGCSYTAAEGIGFCAQDVSCSGPASWTTSSDCAGAQICAVDACCGAQDICMNLQCDDPARMLIKQRRQADD